MSTGPVQPQSPPSGLQAAPAWLLVVLAVVGFALVQWAMQHVELRSPVIFKPAVPSKPVEPDKPKPKPEFPSAGRSIARAPYRA